MEGLTERLSTVSRSNHRLQHAPVWVTVLKQPKRRLSYSICLAIHLAVH
jgi:hypothetical protein